MGMLDGKITVLQGEIADLARAAKDASSDQGLVLTGAERRVLATVLDRQRTAFVVHGGLRGLLGLAEPDAEVLLDFLRRALA